MAGNFGVAISENKAFLVSVENDGYSIEEYLCTDFGVKDFEGCFSFSLENELYFCARRTLYQFIKEQHKWKELAGSNMEIVRYGTACVSLEKGTIIAGGEEFDGVRTSKLKDSCVFIRRQGNKFIRQRIGKLPIKVKHHTLTKVSDNAFIMCGGMDANGYESSEVYLGTLKHSTNDTNESVSGPDQREFYVNWTKLPKMKESRSGHFSMYSRNTLYVFGGGLKRTEKQHVTEVNAMQCGLEISTFAGMIAEVLPFKIEAKEEISQKSQFLVGKWKRRYMKYDIS